MHIAEAYKRYPFRAEPSRIGHYWKYPTRVTSVLDISVADNSKANKTFTQFFFLVSLL